MTTALVFLALFLVKSLYAVVLSHKRFRKLQPDGTWVLVAIGVGLCIAAAGIDRRFTNPSIEVFEVRVWLFLLVGGIPIAIWQIGRSARALIDWFKRVMERLNGQPGDEAD